MKKYKTLALLILTLLALTLVFASCVKAPPDDPAAKKGLVTENGGKYFYEDGGKVKNVWKSLDGSYYYFSSDGSALKGEQTLSDKLYIFSSEGKLLTGEVSVDGSAAFIYNGSKVSSQWVTIKDKEYYVGADSKIAKSESGTINAGQMLCNVYPDGAHKTGVVTENGKRYWYEDGTAGYKTGWVSNSQYYASEDGTLVTGINVIDGKFISFSESGSFERYLKNEEIEYGGKKVYVKSNSIAAKSEWVTVGGKQVWFDADGQRLPAGTVKLAGKWYKLASDGSKEKEYKNEFVTSGGAKYYVNGNGMSSTDLWIKDGDDFFRAGSDGKILTGTKTVDSVSFTFGSDGKLVKDDANIYAIDKNGKMTVTPKRNGLIEIDEKTYYYISGVLQTGWQTVGGVKYYFDTADGGAMAVSKFLEISGQKYYFGSDGKYKTGLVEISGKKYCFGSSDGKQLTGWQTVGGVKYYFDTADGGAMAVSKFLTISEKQYYFDADGKTLEGIHEVGDYWYDFNSDGSLKGRLENTFLSVGTDLYYLMADGKPAKSRFVKDQYGSYYYLGSDGKAATAPVTVGGVAYNIGPDGIVVPVTGKRFVYDEEAGTLQIVDKLNGFVTESGVTRYYENDVYVTGLKAVSGKTYYFDSATGAMAKSTFKTVSSKTYYFGSDGAALTGTQMIGDCFYDFDANGVQTKKYVSEKVTWGGAFYYVNPDGNIAKNEWASSVVFRYRAGADGKLLTGWQIVDENNYYFKPATAAMAKSETLTIDGTQYKFNSDGLLILTDDDIGADNEFTKRY